MSTAPRLSKLDILAGQVIAMGKLSKPYWSFQDWQRGVQPTFQKECQGSKWCPMEKHLTLNYILQSPLWLGFPFSYPQHVYSTWAKPHRLQRPKIPLENRTHKCITQSQSMSLLLNVGQRWPMISQCPMELTSNINLHSVFSELGTAPSTLYVQDPRLILLTLQEVLLPSSSLHGWGTRGRQDKKALPGKW